MFDLFIVILVLILLIFCGLLFIWFIVRLDCDSQLLLYKWLGQPISRLKGKVCWITGASSGIGEALALVLAENGVKLVISGTNLQRLQSVKSQCLSFGQLSDSDVHILCFDVTDCTQNEHRLEEVLTKFGTLDILVSNAGRSQRAAFHEIDVEVDRQLFDVNVFGPITLARVVVKYFIDKEVKGHIVVTSSTAGKMGSPFSSSYSASKYALHGYFESLRCEVYSYGISVTMVCPGPVYSRVLENLFTAKVGIIHNLESEMSKHKHRMESKRCARLMSVAIVHRLDEVWICRQPLLSLYYLCQYLPTISRTLMPRLATKERLNRFREGLV